MSGIAGIGKPQEHERVGKMLDMISYRGSMSRQIMEIDGNTIGIVASGREMDKHANRLQEKSVSDWAGQGHHAEARIVDSKLELYRDQLGVAPLYYSIDNNGVVYFASEVKALHTVKTEVNELLPGNRLINAKLVPYYFLEKQVPVNDDLNEIKIELKRRLTLSVTDRIKSNLTGSWLSGGLDSSIIAALAKSQIDTFHTFVTGIKGAEDLEYAREVARYIGSVHHELVVTMDDMLEVLPDVIYHLESFDALLVRSSITNYLVARFASDYVSEVFSGEGGDEFFAGYQYLKEMPIDTLDDELITISRSLHNTALQRVDRCASTHGTTAHVIFADPTVFEYALRIPIEYKMNHGIEKWILRQAMEGELPDKVLKRTKSKFWEGAGINCILSDYANIEISDKDFAKERYLSNGGILNTKEELMYYRIFREYYGVSESIDWMGRTKYSPTC